MDFLGLIIISMPLILEIYCFIKEPKVTGYYKAMNIYGRIYALIAAGIVVGLIEITFIFLVLVIFGLPEGVSCIDVLGALIQQNGIGDVLFTMITGYVVPAAIGIYMYYRVYKLSPDFMKKRCLIDLTISGVGTLARVVFWFVRLFVQTWWVVAMPDMYMLDNGLAVYIFPNGKVYDSSNNRFGIVTDDKTAVIWKKRN